MEKDDKQVFLSDQIDVHEAQDRLKKKYNTSLYSAEFCTSKVQPKEIGETAILSYKKYSELPLAVMLNENAKKCLDTWLALNDLEVYKTAVLQTLRSLFALIKIQSVSKSHYTNEYQYNKALVVPAERIDKRLFAKTTVGTAAPRPQEPKAEEPVLEEQTGPQVASAPVATMTNPTAIRKELLKGNGYITASCFVPDKVSNYQATFKNPLIGQVQAIKVTVDMNTSMAIGGVSPDPNIISNFTI